MKTYGLRIGACASLIFAVSYSLPALSEEEQKVLTLDTRGLQSFRIDADAGFLHIQGVPSTEAGAETIEVTADIEVKGDKYRLTLEKNGNRAVLISDLEDHWAVRREYINLTVRVPDRLTLDIDDDSGEIKLSNMRADAAIEDGSGELVVKNHHGKLAIDDDSGSIDIQGVFGDLSIEDDSGDLSVLDVNGNVSITDDSGGIRVKNVTGHVSINDGSGSINVANVSQGLTILEDGSGKLSTSGIQGGMDVHK